MKKKKVKKTNRCKLACNIIQLYARLRDTDRSGYGRCCSCGKSLSWSEGQGGHFQSKTRAYNRASLNEKNVNLQCGRCNLFLGSNSAGYSQFMIDTYGREQIEIIKQQSYQTMEPEFIEAQIIEYRTRCRTIASTKNFVVKAP